MTENGIAPGHSRGAADRRPAVSVVIPFHGTKSPYLLEAVESVLTQDFGDFELLLVSDAATSDALATAEEAVARDPERVRLLGGGETPAGCSASRNIGLAAARGEFFAMLDSDDVWLPGKLSAHVAALRAEPQAAMAYGDTLYWHSWRSASTGEDFVPRAGFPPGTLIRPPELLARFLDGRAAVPCTCSVLVRTDVAREMGGFVSAFTGLYDDQVFYAKFAAERSVIYCGKVRERYRRHPDSCCATSDEGAQERARQQFLDWLDAWLDERGVCSADLRSVVRRERALLRHPRAGRVLRRARSFARRLARLGRGY